MEFYWVLFLLILLIAIIDDKRDLYWIVFGLLFVLAITRNETVGSDLKGIYKEEFYTISWNPETWGISMSQNELGFSFIIAFFKTYVSSYFLVCFNFILGVTFVLYSMFLYKYSKYPTWALFFMFALAYYFECFNGMRQQLCDSILTSFVPLLLFIDKNNKYYVYRRCKLPHYFSVYIREGLQRNNVKKTKNRWKTITILFLFSFLVLLTSFLLHKSQVVFLLFIPILFLYNTKWCTTSYLLLYLVLAFLLSVPISRFAQENFASLSALFAEDNSHIGLYLSSEADDEYSQFSNLLNTLFCMYVVYTHRYKRSFFLCLYVFGVILLDILTPINWIYQRIAFVFMFYRVLVFSDLMFELPNKNEKIVFRIAVLLYSAFLFYKRLINDNFIDVVPYDNYFF